MKAILLTGDGYAGTATGPLIDNASDWVELATVPLPVCDISQALIRMRCASVNPSDIHFLKGEYGQPRIRGQAAGFEGCGDVVAGPNALIGKRVAFAAPFGAWAEYAAVDALACIPLDDNITDHDGAGQIVNPLTARAMMGIAAEAGGAVIISAATSQLGKLMISLGRDMGIKTIATARRDVALGADVTLNTQSPDFVAQAKAAISEHKPRVMLDAVCDQTTEKLFTMMPNRARWVSYGKLSTQMPQLTQMRQMIFMDKKIEGFWLTGWFRNAPREEQLKAIRDVQQRFADGRWSTDVASTLRLDQVIPDLADALRKPDGKTIIQMTA